MRLRREDGGFVSHLMPALALILAGTIAVILVYLAPDLQWFLPDAIRRRRIGMALIALAGAYAVARQSSGLGAASAHSRSAWTPWATSRFPAA